MEKGMRKRYICLCLVLCASVLFIGFLFIIDGDKKLGAVNDEDNDNAAAEVMETSGEPEIAPTETAACIPYSEFTMKAMRFFVNVEYMDIMSEPDFGSDVVGHISFGACVEGEACEAWKQAAFRQYAEGNDEPIDESVKWLKTVHEGTEGYIFCGVTDDGEMYIYDREKMGWSQEIAIYISTGPESYPVWINVEYIDIMLKPDFESEVVGKIPYGTLIFGDSCDAWQTAIYQQNIEKTDEPIDENLKWLHISYDGIDGFIFAGVTDYGESYVVYNEDELGSE